MANSSSRKIYLSVGIVFLLIMFLHYLGLLKHFENGIKRITVPILTNMNGFSIEIGNNYRFFKGKQEFFAAFEECTANVEGKEVLEEKIKLLTDENASLRNQLHYVERSKAKSVLAMVVGREVLSTDQSIIIDRGAEDGIKPDQPVIVGDGIIIGKVVKADERISTVRLLNHNQSRVGAMILNNDKSQGVVEGGFGISLKMNLIPRDESVVVGEQVVTSGLENSIPQGLLVGSVAVVENEPYKPFQQAILKPGTNLSKLTVVSVLLTK